MKLHSSCVFLQNYPPPTKFSPPQLQSANKHNGSYTALFKQMPRFQVELKSIFPSLRSRVAMRAANSNSSRKLSFQEKGFDPFRGKSGSVSFVGITHQSIEESKLVSAPFKENTGSLLWVLAPVALISALIVPQFYIVSAIEGKIKNDIFVEVVSSLSIEIVFYAGLAIFFLITEHVQKPYLQFSSKRWGLITGLRGYLTSAFFTMGLKVFAPLLALSVTWPTLGFPALIAVAPFLIGCLIQLVFERILDSKRSSSWPLLPIIFEVYRLYQLTRATGFIERLLYGMAQATVTRAVIERSGALVFMMMTFRALGVVCLWSFLTFLLRLFPSRPVAENY